MRTRLFALVAVVLLLAPLPALAAPERGEAEPRDSVIDSVLTRLADSLSRVFGTSEEDNGPTVDPDGLVAPSPPPAGARSEPHAAATHRQ
jgi:hypothetical protein